MKKRLDKNNIQPDIRMYSNLCYRRWPKADKAVACILLASDILENRNPKRSQSTYSPKQLTKSLSLQEGYEKYCPKTRNPWVMYRCLKLPDEIFEFYSQQNPS